MPKNRNILKKLGEFLYPSSDLDPENLQRLDTADSDRFLGRMDNPDTAGVIQGPCGDSMEFYMMIHNGVISEIKYYTDGCENTRAAGNSVARRALGKTIKAALRINPAEIIDAGEIPDKDGHHCAILAVSTFYRAIVIYLLRTEQNQKN